MDIWERIRFARDQAIKAEETERQRIAEADTEQVQQAASVRLATRQAVREALDDILDEHSEPAKGQRTAEASASSPDLETGADSDQG
jgi:transposase-like protein